jgi:hypothetical protein
MGRHARALGIAALGAALLACGLSLSGNSDNATTDQEGGALDDAQADDALGAPPDAEADGGSEARADACEDLQTNTHNCGACGHDCLGGACAGGACQPFPIALGQRGPRGLALDEDHVYWANYGSSTMANGEIKRRAKDLATPEETLASGEDTPRRIVVAGGRAYWTNHGDAASPAVRAVGLDGGAPADLSTAIGKPFGIAVAEAVYVASEATASVYSVPLVGGAASTIFTFPGTQSQAVDVRVTGSSLFVTKVSPPEVHRFTTAGMDDKKAAGLMIRTPEYLAVGESAIYWSQNGTGPAYLDGAVWTSSLDPSQNAKPLLPIAGYPMGIALDGATLYIALHLAAPDGAIVSCPATGTCVPTTVAGGQDRPLEVAADAKAIYWTAAARVWRLAK